jgi:hypothetical protein
MERIKARLRVLWSVLQYPDQQTEGEYTNTKEIFETIKAKHGLTDADFLDFARDTEKNSIVKLSWIAQGDYWKVSAHAMKLYCALIAGHFDTQAVSNDKGATLLGYSSAILSETSDALAYGWNRLQADWKAIKAYKLLKDKDKSDYTEGFSTGYLMALRADKKKKQDAANISSLILIENLEKDLSQDSRHALMPVNNLVKVAQEAQNMSDDTGTITPEFKNDAAFIIGMEAGLKALLKLLK